MPRAKYKGMLLTLHVTPDGEGGWEWALEDYNDKVNWCKGTAKGFPGAGEAAEAGAKVWRELDPADFRLLSPPNV